MKKAQGDALNFKFSQVFGASEGTSQTEISEGILSTPHTSVSSANQKSLKKFLPFPLVQLAEITRFFKS